MWTKNIFSDRGIIPFKKGSNLLGSICIGLVLIMNTYQLSFSQTGWVSQSGGTTEHLQSVFFINSLTGWTVGNSAKILKTTNGGTNWFSQTSPTTHPLLSVFFASPLSGWAVGGEGDIIATGNGGTNWLIQSTGSTSALNSVFFIDAFTGWAVGEFMTILRTTNSGVNWASLLSGEVALHSVIFTSVTTGYIAGSSGYVMKSTNMGSNWTVTNSNVAYNLYSIHFPVSATSMVGYTVGMGSPSPPILKSVDAGNNWSIQSVPLGDALTSVFFSDLLNGWAVGFIGTIMHTTNGGTTWPYQVSGTGNSLRSTYFFSSSTGWAVGDLGTILKTTNGGVTFISRINNEIPLNYNLSQNYPNPFNPVTKIKFSITEFPLNKEGLKGVVTLLVYDITGKEVAKLVNEQLPPGTYEVTFDGSNYLSGIYFYQLKSEKFLKTKKLILLK
jgi:photosystem II stability/assembly factor-like uncharacterized protein